MKSSCQSKKSHKYHILFSIFNCLMSMVSLYISKKDFFWEYSFPLSILASQRNKYDPDNISKSGQWFYLYQWMSCVLISEVTKTTNVKVNFYINQNVKSLKGSKHLYKSEHILNDICYFNQNIKYSYDKKS